MRTDHVAAQGEDRPDPGPAARRSTLATAVLWVLLGAIVIGVVIGMVAFRATDDPRSVTAQVLAGDPVEQWQGRITAVTEADVRDEFLLPGSRSISVAVDLDGRGQVVIDAVDEGGTGSDPIYEVGRRVIVQNVASPGTPELLAIVDLPRGRPLLLLALLFAGAVLALGRWQGLRALTGLVLSAGVIVGWLVPALLTGRSPMLVALVAAVAVMLITLPLSHGLGREVLAAAVGTAAALGLTVLLAQAAVDATALTGLASEDVQFVRFASSNVLDLRGLLLAGMIIGTLGVLDDVTVSQASTVAALRRTDPLISARAVFGEAMAVGRDHIAATVNTLFLAYAGAALPLLLLFSLGGGGVIETLTSELVAQEVVRTLVGSIGLIAAVPIVTGLAALVTDGTGTGVVTGHNHAHPRGSDHQPPQPPQPPPAPARSTGHSGSRTSADADEAATSATDPQEALRRLLGDPDADPRS